MGTSGIYDERCGYGNDFKIPKSEAKQDCETCSLILSYENNEIVEVNRQCFGGSPSVRNKWQNYRSTCSEQSSDTKNNFYCYCDESYCNENRKGIPSTCDVPKQKSYACYTCEWYSEITSLGDPRCRWGGEFSVPSDVNDLSVTTDCIKCAVSLTYVKGSITEVIRFCIGEDDVNYYNEPKNYCSSELLQDGRFDYCYCDGDFCNKDDSKSPNVCPNLNQEVAIMPPAPVPKATINCYSCQWKRLAGTTGPYNDACGYGSDFTVPANEVEGDCQSCYLGISYKEDEIVEIARFCIGALTGELSWLNRQSQCSEQPNIGGKDQFCFCDTDRCNVITDGIPSSCKATAGSSINHRTSFTLFLACFFVLLLI